MKTTIKLINLLTIALFITVFSCSNDDDAPTAAPINLQDLELAIDENPTNGQVLGTVQSNATSALSFSITTQAPNNALDVDATTGELTVADASLFDFETYPTITATVAANGAVNTSTVTINLTNVNELNVQDFTTTIDENPSNGDVLGTVQATGDATLSYSIVSQTPSGAVNIDANTGALTVADGTVFDFEVNPVITANIEVDNSGNIDTIVATINLNNVNELSIQDFMSNIDENSPTGTSLGTVQAAGDGTLSYSITSQSPAGTVTINSNTGELTIADETLFDFEVNPTISANITVNNSVSTETAVATINLINVNELGDLNYGGIIFWLDPNDNDHGLVCALDNQMSNAWGCSGVNTGATGTAIGTGATNTVAITSSACAAGTAAELVSNLNLNGFNDWYLPSLDEFNEIDINYQSYIWPTVQANGGSAFFGTVWTSTEVSNNNAYIAFFGGSNPIAMDKTVSVFNILPIRSF
ncbi:hypothetical protein [Olleya sp. YS]|uniref:hypothetical protein n=1 Tax=Olleya sp. YS TaxID=3028318 RepID=UPI0024344B9E|nr:hypothetical protein [Olleya sp. YS]WGD34536.1 hypothetical protein Ollyesu_12195 [Olleya sp. YS]